MRHLPLRTVVCACLLSATLHSQSATSQKHPVVLWQSGFPTVDSSPIPRDVLSLAVPHASFADIGQLKSGALGSASVLVLPYGSAVPSAAWQPIEDYLHAGGNLLFVGGQPLRVPVDGDHEGAFTIRPEQESYSRELGFLHSYLIPDDGKPKVFAWRRGYEFLPSVSLSAHKVFAVEGRLNGLGYLESSAGEKTAAAVIYSDHLGSARMNGSRVVALPWTADAKFWQTEDARTLLKAVTQFAQAGATSFNIEVQYAALRPGEKPEVTLHLRRGAPNDSQGKAEVQTFKGDQLISSQTVPLGGLERSAQIHLEAPIGAGVYRIKASWSANNEDGEPIREFAENGFVVESSDALNDGPALGSHGDFLTFGGKPFFPVGTNYFSTDANGWDFSGPRNDATWERDFADMQKHGVNFVRTGVWMSNSKFVEPETGEVNERFLRNLEAFLSAAHRHEIAVNFTFFAFTPHGLGDRRPQIANDAAPLPNPYLDPTTVGQEKQYISSIVHRFRNVPWLSYDLINEPSFSNPRVVFHGNVPNGDPSETKAWQSWLRSRYHSVSDLADAWRVTPQILNAFDKIELPKSKDIEYTRYSNQLAVRAFDYNLFAQDMFSGWVRGMVESIRSVGSKQLINVGQDEGGVTNRLLNQFYGSAGVSFTTNHTYWSDDALLWDSVAAKRPGLPNITGETGYQPAWNLDGSWRYDELTGTALEERKLVLGFAAGSSGAMQWDWDREVDFGMQRSDGSAKVWEQMMQELGAFAKNAAPYASGLSLPEIAIILPQTLQLSAHNAEALAAQQAAVRTLFQRNRVEAYAVGEFQTDTLGSPKLIILPSAYGLSAKAWSDIEDRVRAGAVLLASGPFNEDEHLHPTARSKDVAINSGLAELLLRDNTLSLPTGKVPLLFEGLRTTTLDRSTLPNGETWEEVPLGKGKILFSVFPLELNSHEESIAAAYDVAIRTAGVHRSYTTSVSEPGILICPTRLPGATLYAITSEAPTQLVTFTDARSGKVLSATIDSGHAALLLVSKQGNILANYRWRQK